MAASDDIRFWRQLNAKINEIADDKEQSLLRGTAKSLEEYQGQANYLRALRDVQAWAEQAFDEMNRPENRRS